MTNTRNFKNPDGALQEGNTRIQTRNTGQGWIWRTQIFKLDYEGNYSWATLAQEDQEFAVNSRNTARARAQRWLDIRAAQAAARTDWETEE